MDFPAPTPCGAREIASPGGEAVMEIAKSDFHD